VGSISPTCLLKALMHPDPKSIKKTDDLADFFDICRRTAPTEGVLVTAAITLLLLLSGCKGTKRSI